MLAWLARPAESEPSRGLLVFQEAFGVNSHIRNVTERFASQGFVAIAPELFHRTAPAKFEGSYNNFASSMPHMQALREVTLTEDIRAAYQWLKSHTRTGENIVSVGYCMGGRTSFLANTIVPLKAAVSYYGGNIPQFLANAGKSNGPLLLIWGDLDKHIPAEQRQQVGDALRQAKKVFADMVFSDADHGFFCDERASYQAKAAGISWDLTQSFLDTYLS